MATLKIATYNVNGIRGRIARLLEWLERERPDIVCLQELKSEQGAFPERELRDAGYGALWVGQKSWNGVAILARDADPVAIRRALPGDAADTQARYLEAAVDGILVACLYLPNGNPQPGPKFDYKLAWFERLILHARSLYASGQPVVIAGDYNVVPTDFDIYSPKSWLKDALLQPASRACYRRLLDQGWIDSLRELHPDERIYTFWDYFRQHWQRNSGLRIDHLLLNPPLAKRLRAAGVDTWVRGREGASDHAPTWIEIDASTAASKSTSTRKTTAKPARKKAATVRKSAAKKATTSTGRTAKTAKKAKSRRD
jgi:exodeoxyribonuclease III